MRYKLDDLANNTILEIRNKFTLIPINYNEVEFTGNYYQSWGSWSPSILSALTYLPRHINHVTFCGIYNHHTIYYEVEDGTTFFAEGGDLTRYKKVEHYIQTVGNMLQYYITALPTTINHVSIKFPYRGLGWDSTAVALSTEFATIFKNIPENITHFDFPGNFVLTETKSIRTNIVPTPTMFANLPKTVSSLSIGYLGFDEKMQQERIKEIISAIRPEVTTLHINGNRLSKLTQEYLLVLLRTLYITIQSLNMSDNNLGSKNATELFSIFLALPPQLLSLQLAGNNLSSMKAQDLSYALSGLPKNLEHIDLGENKIFSMDTKDITTILSGLQPHIKSIRISDKFLNANNAAYFNLLLACLPKHCTTLSFSDSNFLGLSVAQFAELISLLPKSIITLDLSGLNLNKLAIKDLQLLLSKIPPTVTHLIVKRNHLNSMDPYVCKEAFSALHKNLTELDLRENGIDRLYNNQMNRLLNAFPDLVLLVEKEIGIRNDGTLTLFSGMGHHGLFKPKGRIKHQKEFAEKVLANVKPDDRGASKEMNVIFPFVLEEWAQTTNQVELAKTLIPSKNTASVKDSKAAVAYRIGSFIKGSDKLDLSCCDLSSLPNANELAALFRQIPEFKPNHLSLRDNGFNRSRQTRTIFIAALAFIPNNIYYLDLSGNGFEQDNAEQLEQLFKNLPPSIRYISLGHEKPISPAEQIAKRKWPNSYSRLTNDSDDIMKKALVLLNDYTKNDSMFQRFLFLHWNRGYTNEVTRLVRYIDKGVITNMNDLLSEFDQIKIFNETGSLRKRLAFLAQSAEEQTAEIGEGNLISC